MSYQNAGENESNDLSVILSDSQERGNGSKLFKFLTGAVLLLGVVTTVILMVGPDLSNSLISSLGSTLKTDTSEDVSPILLLGSKSETEKKDMFFSFKDKHGKKYKTQEEELERYEKFKTNLNKIDTMNIKNTNVQYEITRFADMSEEEFSSINGLKFQEQLEHVQSIHSLSAEEQAENGYVAFEELEAELFQEFEGNVDQGVDWRKNGRVTKVKDQGMCGDCWAFAACGDMEGTWQEKSGQLVSLSEQYLTDCDQGDQGCQGGMMSTAYQWVIRNGGMQTEDDYPFTSGDSGKEGVCKLSGKNVKGDTPTIDSWTLIKGGAPAIKAMLKTKGPVAVAINAVQMQFYGGGVDVPTFCLWGEVNHGVLLVGYGNENGQDYWIVKNSWGSDWGENGYYRIATANGGCGIEEIPMKSL